MQRLFITLSLLLAALPLSAQTINLSGDGWRAKLDTAAQWQNDILYLPDELPTLSELPVNAPTDGWASLIDTEKEVSVPMTIDEYFLEGINTKTYEGVSWVWRTFTAPSDIDSKVILLHIAKARMRAEVYINEQLAAYDVVGDTPFTFDVSDYIIAGEENQIAIRLTNPGGRRGWFDIGSLYWGDYCYALSGRNFSTLGDVTLAVREKVYVEDIFVKNILPANSKKVAVTAKVINTTDEIVNKPITLTVKSEEGGKKVASQRVQCSLNPGENIITTEMTLSHAKLWSPESSNLYSMTSKLSSDSYSVSFGVRTFEVLRGESGGDNYYLNGKRFIFRTAIDWGFYTPTGDYATAELAEKSVEAAKAMGQNGISFHRSIGEPLVMDYADRVGICTYEEPGGFHPFPTAELQDPESFISRHTTEKIKRMIIRDRNHPSMIIYSLSNEHNAFPRERQEALALIHSLDNSRLIVNTSGPLDDKDKIPHYRPYEDTLRWDNYDFHTALTQSPIYTDREFYQGVHRNEDYTEGTYFLGEVNSVPGPINWYKTYEDILRSGKEGYDTNIYTENHAKTKYGFDRWNLSESSQSIKTPEDVSVQSGRGMMYAHARHAQSILCNNTAEGYALNGWTPGPHSEGTNMDWSSAILDEGRNIKGPAEVFTYWTRTLQIALARKNGKYFEVGDTVTFESNLINHNHLAKGDYTLNYSIGDEVIKSMVIAVEGGDCYAQSLEDISFITKADWKAGYITLTAELLKSGKVVADGSEQILLQNRATYAKDLEGLNIEVRQWDEAANALTEAGATLAKKDSDADIIVFGNLSAKGLLGKYGGNISNWDQMKNILKRVEDGATLIVRFDDHWADVFYHLGVLSEEVTEWGGNQTGEWVGNGWGYLDGYVESTIGTTSWEVSGDPKGFYPFESEYKMNGYGLYMCRPWLCKVPPIGFRRAEVQPTVAVTLASIEYGEGKIILNPCYWVDEDNAFCDMLFFNLVIK